jgi:hypothetical protein
MASNCELAEMGVVALGFCSFRFTSAAGPTLSVSLYN